MASDTLTQGGVLAVILLLTVHLLVGTVRVLRANRALKSAARHRTQELSVRTQQLHLLNNLSSILAEETRRPAIIKTVARFLVEDMGALAADYWKPGADGQPDAPSVTFPDTPSTGDPRSLNLSAPQRLILARTAATDSLPLVITAGAHAPRPLDPAALPAGDFALFLPLRGPERPEGVFEIFASGSHWGSDKWEVIESFAAAIGTALERARHYDELREKADMDYVTGLFNHRFMQSYLHQLLRASAARDRSLALLLMDIDNFKMFNDTYGHSVGDRVLQLVADQLKLMTDRVGIVGRFGGDEFIVVLPGHSRAEGAALAQAFHDWLTNVGFNTPTGQTVPILVSCGLAVFPDDGDKRQELLTVADAHLYESKRSGSRIVTRSRQTNRVHGHSLGVFGLLDSLVTSIDNKDHYTRAHCETTAEYAVLLAQELNLSPSAHRTLRLAALLHDVGKICIPDSILRKPGRLSPDEFAVIKHHVAMAEHLIVDIPNADEVRHVAKHHHERFDGSGYPSGLCGEQIPQLARILAVADAFSAITLDRPYRKGRPYDQAYRELKRVAGSQLDPQLVAAFGPVITRIVRETHTPVALPA